MATEKIDEIFDIQAINKQVSEVIKKIESVTAAMENSVERIAACNGEIASSKTFDELNKATGKFIKVNNEYVYQSKEMAKLKQTEVQLNQKLQDSYLNMAKKVEEVRQEVAEKVKTMKESVKVQREQEKADKAASRSINDVIGQLKRQRDSVSELTAENKRLRDLVKSMDYNTQKAEIEQINTVIDANTALVELNSDAYVKQKMNIGNYKTAVEGLDTIMKSLEKEMKRVADAGGKDSDEFKKLQAEFDKARQVATGYNVEISRLSTTSDSLKKELRELKEQMQQMELSGQGSTEVYEQLRSRAVELTRAINGVNDQIKNMEPPTATFDTIMSGLTGLAGGFQAFQGVMGLCNLENEEFEKIQAKVQSAIAITNGLTAIKAALDKNSALMVGLNTAAQSSNVVVSKAATIAQKALNAAMKASPVFLLVTGILAGVTALGAWLASTREVSAEQKRQNEVHDKAIDNYAREKTEIEGLASRIKEGNTSREDQARVVAILTEKYGENYVKGKSMQELENAFIDNAGAFVESAMKKAEAQAAFELAVEAQKKALEAGTKGVEEYVGWFGRLFRSEEAEIKLANERRQKEVTSMEKLTQLYLESYAERQKAAEAAMKKSGESSKVEQKTEADKLKRMEELRNRDSKAIYDRGILKIQQQMDVQKTIYNDESNSYMVRLNALVNHENKEVELVEKQRDFLLANTRLTAEERKSIEEKAAEDIRKIKANNERDFTSLEQQETVRRTIELNSRLDNRVMDIQKSQDRELLVLSKKYAKGEMNEEQYGKSKFEISKKYNKMIFDYEIQTMTTIANMLPEKDRLKVLKEIKEKELAYIKQCNEQEIAENDKKGLSLEEKENLLKNARIQLAQDAYSTIASIANSMFERKIQQIDDEIRKVDEQKEHDLAVVEEMNISDEEKEARKKAIEARAQTEKEKLEKQKKKVQKQQAITDKMAALVGVAINTALGVSDAMSKVVTMPLVPFIIATGAMQAAIIAAQPLPQYAQGTEDHPGGLAIVGDGGKKELVKTPDGEYLITPDIPTLVDLPKHAEVIPDFNLALRGLLLTPVIQDEVPNYNEEMKKELVELRKAVNEITIAVRENRPQMNVNLDKNGLWSTYERQKGQTKYLNERLNIQR